MDSNDKYKYKDKYKPNSYPKITGIYGITFNHCLVYIGKSVDIYERRASHWKHINNSMEEKYKLMRAAVRDAHIYPKFWILQKCKEEDLDRLEREWIKWVKPVLNSKFNGNRLEEVEMGEFFEMIIGERDSFKGVEGIECMEAEIVDTR